MSENRRSPVRRIYVSLLRLYPAKHRRNWEAGMLVTFDRRADALRGAGYVARSRFFFRELSSVLVGALRERVGSALGAIRKTSADLVGDLGFGFRSLAATPSFTIIAVLALALGIGATTAMFSVVDAVLLRPLPFREPDRIVRVWETAGDWLRNSAAPANYIDWRDTNASFEYLAADAGTSMNLTGGDEPLRLTGRRVTREFFATLGVSASIGRTLGAEDDIAGAPRVVVLSDTLWRSRFAGNPQIVGEEIVLDGRPHAVIGVMPSGFAFPLAGTQFWVPMAFDTDEAQRRGFRYLSMIGRLADGASVEGAHEELRAIAARLAQEYPDVNEHVSAHLMPLREELDSHVQQTLLSVLGAIALVLLIACANVAFLILTRATGRRGEIAVRAALGAGRWRIVRQMATESLLLAGAAGIFGLLFASWSVRFLAALVPRWMPLSVPIGLDARIVVFAAALSGLTVILFGLVPAWRGSRPDLADALRAGRATSALQQQRLRAVLVVGEVALVVVLLIGAGLMVRSFAALLAEDIGFEPAGVLRLRLGLTAERYDDGAARQRFYEELLQQTRALPGATHAAVSTAAPLGMSGGALIYTPEGQATHPQDATFRVISEDYFAALGIGLRGRDFAPSDGGDAPEVIVIGREVAERAWPGESPLGKRLKIGDEDSTDPWRTVVGVADDVRHWDLELEPRPAIYVPFRQVGVNFAPRDLLLRTAGAPASLAVSARAAVAAIDENVPVTIDTMSELLAAAAAARRFNMQLFGAFAGVALLLASIGLWGTVAYAVAHRTHEIGIRMALGARERAVVTLMTRQGLVPVALGLALGMLGGAVAGRSLSSLLYEVGGLDPWTFAVVPVVLALVGIAATLVPAWRASAVEPVIALRRE